MFEQVFKTQLSSFNADITLINKLWMEIRDQYTEPGRYYHTLTHLDNLVECLTSVVEKILDWQSLVISIAYHDMIYNIFKSDNEDKSAELADKRLLELGVSQTQRDKCYSQILATKGHNLSEDSDTNYFTDADLSILGAPDDEYIHYTDLIRKEYKYFPDFLYKQGRKKVLTHFIGMPRIYKTVHFYDKFEVQARVNIGKELKLLS